MLFKVNGRFFDIDISFFIDIDIMLRRIFLHVLNNTSCGFCLSNKKCPELCFTAEAELFCDKKHGESFN